MSEMRLCERANKIWFGLSVVVIALLYVISVVYFDVSVDSRRSGRFTFATKNTGSGPPDSSSGTTKSILFYNDMFGHTDFYFGSGDVFENCSGIARNCWATHDISTSIFDIKDFDAVLFHGSDPDMKSVPAVRRDRQVYVFVNLESPANRPISHAVFENDFFNLTMTYRLDSDLVWSYADVRELNGGKVVAPKRDTVWPTTFWKSTDPQGTKRSRGKETTDKRITKTKTAIWVVSNCNGLSGRSEYIEELARHVDVDIFGLCGHSTGCPKGNDSCFRQIVEPDYFFYLSFENSMCQDYVTEKLYNALKLNVVPVVYGGANYSRFAPPNSYINALDFDEPRALAEYLKRLTRQPDEYEKYFEWKKHYEIADSKKRVICQLCDYLHKRHEPKSYTSLSAWYQSEKCPLQKELKDLFYLTGRDLQNQR